MLHIFIAYKIQIYQESTIYSSENLMVKKLKKGIVELLIGMSIELESKSYGYII